MARFQTISVIPAGPPGFAEVPAAPRLLRGYPLKITTGIRRTKKELVRRRLFRLPRPRRHARSRFRTTMDELSALAARASKDFDGSLEERIFYQALVDHKLIPGVDFTAQASALGGRMELGGLVADFMFPAPKVIVQVQSVWHTMDMEIGRRDSDQAAVLENMGYTVLEIWPNTIHSQAALDWWIERNIHYLFGTSQQFLGGGVGVDANYIDTLMKDYNIASYITHMLVLVEAMLQVVK